MVPIIKFFRDRFSYYIVQIILSKLVEFKDVDVGVCIL